MSSYKIQSRHFQLRISDITNIDKIKEYIKKNEHKIKYALIGAVEQSKEKKDHVHVAISFNSATTGKAIMTNMFGDFSKIAHYIGHKYSKENEGEGSSYFDNGTDKCFYGYVKKNGILFEYGTPVQDKFKQKDDDDDDDKKKDKPKEDSNEKKIKQTEAARRFGNKTEFREWMIENGYLNDLYNPWVDKMMKIECKSTLKQAKQRFLNSGYTDVKCIYVRDIGGSGKTFILNEIFPNHYPLDITSEYWEDYDSSNPDHGVVVIDELDTLKSLSKIGGTEFLRKLFDNHPIPVKTKWNNGESYVRPHTVILINNIELRDLIDEEFNKQKQSQSGVIIDAVYRRFSKQRSLKTAEFAAEFGKQLLHDGFKIHEHTNRKWMINPRLIDIPIIYKNREPQIINNEYIALENEINILKLNIEHMNQENEILKIKLRKYNDNSILLE